MLRRKFNPNLKKKPEKKLTDEIDFAAVDEVIKTLRLYAAINNQIIDFSLVPLMPQHFVEEEQSVDFSNIIETADLESLASLLDKEEYQQQMQEICSTVDLISVELLEKFLANIKKRTVDDHLQAYLQKLFFNKDFNFICFDYAEITNEFKAPAFFQQLFAHSLLKIEIALALFEEKAVVEEITKFVQKDLSYFNRLFLSIFAKDKKDLFFLIDKFKDVLINKNEERFVSLLQNFITYLITAKINIGLVEEFKLLKRIFQSYPKDCEEIFTDADLETAPLAILIKERADKLEQQQQVRLDFYIKAFMEFYETNKIKLPIFKEGVIDFQDEDELVQWHSTLLLLNSKFTPQEVLAFVQKYPELILEKNCLPTLDDWLVLTKDILKMAQPDYDFVLKNFANLNNYKLLLNLVSDSCEYNESLEHDGESPELDASESHFLSSVAELLSRFNKQRFSANQKQEEPNGNSNAFYKNINKVLLEKSDLLRSLWLNIIDELILFYPTVEPCTTILKPLTIGENTKEELTKDLHLLLRSSKADGVLLDKIIASFSLLGEKEITINGEQSDKKYKITFDAIKQLRKALLNSEWKLKFWQPVSVKEELYTTLHFAKLALLESQICDIKPR